MHRSEKYLALPDTGPDDGQGLGPVKSNVETRKPVKSYIKRKLDPQHPVPSNPHIITGEDGKWMNIAPTSGPRKPPVKMGSAHTMVGTTHRVHIRINDKQVAQMKAHTKALSDWQGQADAARYTAARVALSIEPPVREVGESFSAWHKRVEAFDEIVRQKLSAIQAVGVTLKNDGTPDVLAFVRPAPLFKVGDWVVRTWGGDRTPMRIMRIEWKEVSNKWGYHHDETEVWNGDDKLRYAMPCEIALASRVSNMPARRSTAEEQWEAGLRIASLWPKTKEIR